MNPFYIRSLVTIFLFLPMAGGITGCSKSGKAEQDSESSTAVGSDSDTSGDSGSGPGDDSSGTAGTETPPDSDTPMFVDTVSGDDTGTATEPATDTADTATVVDTDTGSDTVQQAPVDIHITNLTDHTVYLVGYQTGVAGRHTGGAWHDEYVEAPICTMGCEEAATYRSLEYGALYCCMDCDYDTMLIAILPGDTFTYTFEGRIYKTETETCDCQCYFSEEPVAGTYRFSVDVFNDVSCGLDSCDDPKQTGFTYHYYPQGTSQRFSTTAAIPYTGSGLDIRIVYDGDTETGLDTNTDTDVDTATAIGTDSGSDTDTVTSDTESDTATGTDTGVSQQPIEVRVINQSLSTVYLNGVTPMHGEINVNGDWNALTIAPPSCSFACEDVPAESPEYCCIECEMAIQTFAILPGDTLTFAWDGLIYQRNTTICECGCYYSELPQSGEYRFKVAAQSNAECYFNPCEAPTQSGLLYDRNARGDSRDFSVSAMIPSTGEPLEIVITRDDRCDDGTTPNCRMVPPVCDPATQILAYRNSCYQCVNADTCAPD
ncbi:MAG: hypothetical protein JXX14_09955 [Deltaproteobacteria bacterium]|nr:hypothetical protein [Deltaproteobacteria bacterium]